MENIKVKLIKLWEENRTYTRRLFLSFVVVFTMCFTFLFFGPFEITVTNVDSIAFTPREMVLIMAFFSTIICVIFTLLIALLRGKIFNYVLTFVYALTISGYIQGNFLNNNVSELTGAAIAWETKTIEMLINLIIWGMIFIASYMILYLDKKIWEKCLKFTSIMLVSMQSVALISLVFNGAFDFYKDRTPVLSTSEMFHYSEDTNTLVFILDQLDYDYIEAVIEEDPNFFEQLDGFTNYTNAIAEYTRTVPSLNYILTNAPNAYMLPSGVYMEQSWNQEDKNIIKDLYDADFKINIYTERSQMFGAEPSQDKDTLALVSNIIVDEKKLETENVVESLLMLSSYRYLPLSIKPFFWSYTDEINKELVVIEANEDGIVPYQIDETLYDAGLSEMTLEEEKYFKFYHFNAPHMPYTLLENGKRSAKPTDVVQQTKGVFNILFRAFEEMKKLGIYEKTSIIITADHGFDYINSMPLHKETRIGLFYKPVGSANTPLKYSSAPISQINIPATILKASGLPYDNYGRAIDEIGEEEDIIRYHYKNIFYTKGHSDSKWNEKKEDRLYTYEIRG